MSSSLIFLIAFFSIMAGAIFGMLLRRWLPEASLSPDTKETVRLATGLLATVAALVISLMIASAKSSYDTQGANVRQIVAQLILTDNLLAQYGPEATDARKFLRRSTSRAANKFWHEDAEISPHSLTFSTSAAGDQLTGTIEALSPSNDAQRSLKIRIIQAVTDLTRARLLVFAYDENPLLTPFLMVLIVWLVILFASYSIFAKPSAVVAVAFVIVALSVSSALFLMADLNQPFAGFMQISSEPLRRALAPLDS
jgi:Protein of unknown function (DUF4239)